MSKLIRIIDDKYIQIKEYKNANLVFNTNEYRSSDDICILNETIEPFEMYAENLKLQQENKQLKEEIEEYKRIEQKDLEAFNNYDSILTELEEWLKNEKDYYFENYYYSDFNAYGSKLNDVLDKIQELKEKYK